MRGGLARRMCSDTENSIFSPSMVVVVIGKKLLPQTLQKTVPSFSSGPSTLCPLPGQRTIFGFVMDNRLPSNRTNAIGDRIVEMEGDCKGVVITPSRQVWSAHRSRQVATTPAIKSNPAEGASFPNYSLGGSGPSRETGSFLIVLWKVGWTGATCPLSVMPCRSIIRKAPL